MHLLRGALSKTRRRENTCTPGPRSEAPFGTGGRAEQEQEEAGVPTRSRPPQSRPPHDAPELCPLSPRKPPAYKTVVDLHDFQYRDHPVLMQGSRKEILAYSYKAASSFVVVNC